MFKLAATIGSVLVSMGLAALYPAPPPDDGDGPPPPKSKAKHDAKVKKKEEDRKKDEAKKKDGPPGPAGDLRRAYEMLVRVRADNSPTGRPEERLRDWTDRAVKFYRDGVKAFKDDHDHLAHEYGAIAHDLAEAVDNARAAARFDQADPDLPPPPDGHGPGDSAERARRDLRRAFDRITGPGGESPPADAAFAVKAARDLYRAARRDAEAGRNDRAAALARAAVAMTHAADHLGHIARDRGTPSGKPEPPDDRPEPKKPGRGDRELPPPLPE